VSLPGDRPLRERMAAQSGPVAGILLAAGSSTRLGHNKLLLAFNGETLLRRAARVAAATLDPVVVVLGHEADRSRQELAGIPCRVAVNPDHAGGARSSIRAGITALPDDVPAAVVLLADMPLVTPAMIEALVAAYRATSAPLVVSEYGDVAAPPHLYDRSLFTELANVREGGKEVVARHRASAAVCSWPASILVDVDVPADRRRVEALLASESRPV
jgi:molybdenum cofactor cytidylyltransferase